MSNQASHMGRATLTCIAGYFCIAVMSACAKAVSPHISLMTLLFFQNFIPLLLVAPGFFLYSKGQYAPKQVGTHFIRDLFGLLTFLCLFFSIKYIPLVDGVLLQNTAPLWVPFVVMFWAKKKIPLSVWLGSGVGFIGVIFVLKPGAEIIQPALLVGILAGISLGISLVAIRRLSYTEPTARILFYYFLFGTIVSLPFLFFDWKPLSFFDWGLLMAIGIFMYLSQFLITYAFHHGKASTLAPISYTAVIWAGILGWLIWGYVPDVASIIGMLLIILGGGYAIVMESRNPI